MKRGAGGCFILTPTQLVHHPCMKIQLEDSVGCGDSLAAAVVLAYTRGDALLPALALANAVGGATAARRGAGRNVATAEMVRELLSDCANDEERVEYQESARQALDILTHATSSNGLDRQTFKVSSAV
mmetsp:Transcript_7259/g.12549  ORF Transcript_7259/g.12549 Transcript_7259/m.12549 type:complete len:128 (+) Transcript_7259:2-385(+)